MSVTPNPDDGEPTVVMPARAVADAVPPDIARWLATAKRKRRRRLALCAAAGTVVIAVVAAGWFFFPQNEKSLAVARQPAREVTSPQMTRPAGLPAAPPSPRAPDEPFRPRQMLNEIFEGRDRGYSVAASVERGAVRIGSSRPGYVYVVAASANQSERGALFVAVLFPRAADTNNRVRPGQTFKLPDLQWPADAEFLAIVSDERRDIDVLGPLAGKVNCGAAARCSQSYGAAFFSTAGLSSEGARDTVQSPASPKGPSVRPTRPASRRCSDILERASLGETLTDDEQAFLRRGC